VPRSRRVVVIVAVLAVIVLAGVVAIVSVTTGSGRRPSAARAQSPVSVPASSPSATAAGSPGSQAGGAPLCNSRRLAVDGGVYTVQNNEYDSGAPECLTVGALGGFTVASSAIANSTSGAPGGYPSIYRGCHWGDCTSTVACQCKPPGS
jgi:Glycosyl hydrolase family 12